MAVDGEHLLPVSKDELEELHFDLAHGLRNAITRVFEAVAQMFGDPAAHAAMRAILVNNRLRSGDVDLVRFDKVGWRQYVEDEGMGGHLEDDFLCVMSPWIEGAAYAAQGAILVRPETSDVAERERHVRRLIAFGEDALCRAAPLFGDTDLRIWRAVQARAAIDFGGHISPEGIVLLARISSAAVHNAINSGDLATDADGSISADAARNWLARRRDFCPSRWRNPSDDQSGFNRKEPMKEGQDLVHVPQDGEGRLFVPENVVRRMKSGGGISIYIGLKGQEQQFNDYYAALVALAAMSTPRWRRRNTSGNWGIVRARGPWVAVSKAEIDRQIAAKAAEVA